VVIHGELILLVLISLLNNALDHGHSFGEVVICVCGDEHVHRLFLVDLLSIVNFAFTLGTSTSDLNLASTLTLELLLSLPLRTDDLTYIVDGRVIRVRNVDSPVFLWRFVVRRRLNAVR